jgi:hypothetical protein
MVDMTAIGVVANSLNAAVNITKAMIDLRDWSTVQSKVIELQRTILEAQGGMFAANEERSALIQRVRDLEKEVTELKAWNTEKENYELKSVYIGAFAYLPKPNLANAEPPHWLCATCYQNGKKSLLQYHGRDAGDHRTSLYRCQRKECGSTIRVPWDVNPAEPYQ